MAKTTLNTRLYRWHLSMEQISVLCLYVISLIFIAKVPNIFAHYNQPQYGAPVQQQQHQMYQQQPNQQPHQQVVYQTPGQVPHYQQVPQHGQNLLHDDSRIHDREHIKEHLHESLSEQDVNKMSEEELQFHYFKMHDSDNNNMLDGSELIKSLIHWHVEQSRSMGNNAPPAGTTKLFTDSELEQMIDPILQSDDKNNDGFIDYPEFVAAQKSRGM